MLLIPEILKAQSKNITSKFQRPEKIIVSHNILAYVFLVLLQLKCRCVSILEQQTNKWKFGGQFSFFYPFHNI